MDNRITIKQAISIFENVSGADIDWSASETHLAAYISSHENCVDLAYDFSPATDDSQLAADFWAVYDLVYRTILTAIDLGYWSNIRHSLAIGQISDFDGDLAYTAIQTALRS